MRWAWMAGLLMPSVIRAFNSCGWGPLVRRSMWRSALSTKGPQISRCLSGGRGRAGGGSRRQGMPLLVASAVNSRKADNVKGLDTGKKDDEGDGEEEALSVAKGSGAAQGLDLTAEQARLEQLEKEIYEMAGRRFKITSYLELSRVLFEDLKLPVVKQPTSKVLGGYYSTSNAVLNELSTMGYELPAKVLDYRALLYLIRNKQGKSKKKAAVGEEGSKDAAGGGGSEKAPVSTERMSPEEKLMMSMLKEEAGVDALDRTMERVGVDIGKVMERVQTIAEGKKVSKRKGPSAGSTLEPRPASAEPSAPSFTEEFVPEEGELEKPDVHEPAPVFLEDPDKEAVSLFDKGWGVAENFVLVDASGILYRAYHAMPKLTTPEGTPINAVLGFCNILNKLLLPAMIQSRNKPHVLVVFDGGHPLTRQTQLFPDYKANRPKCPDDLSVQFEIAQEATQAFGGINVTAPAGLEADDVIATFVSTAIEQMEDTKITIVSSDKDFLQLVTDDVTMFDPFNMVRYGPTEVFEKYGLEPYQLLDYFSFVGDSADNVPGVPGVGPKTAQELLEEFETFEELWEFREEIESPRLRKIVEENLEKFLTSRKLIRLKKLFDPPRMESLPKALVDHEKIGEFCERYGLKDLSRRVVATIARVEEAKGARDQALDPFYDAGGGRRER